MSTTVFMNNGSALYNNGRIAISKDLIFGLQVFLGEDEGFQPIASLSADDRWAIFHLIDFDPLFQWAEELQALLPKKQPN